MYSLSLALCQFVSKNIGFHPYISLKLFCHECNAHGKPGGCVPWRCWSRACVYFLCYACPMAEKVTDFPCGVLHGLFETLASDNLFALLTTQFLQIAKKYVHGFHFLMPSFDVFLEFWMDLGKVSIGFPSKSLRTSASNWKPVKNLPRFRYHVYGSLEKTRCWCETNRTSVSEPWGDFLFQNIHNTFSVKKRVCFPNHIAFWNSPNVKVFFPGCVTECSRIMVDSLHSLFSSELNTEVDFIKLSWTSTSADFLRSVRPPRNQAWQHNHQQVQAIWRPVEAPRESRESSESVEPCSLQVYSVWMFQRMALILTWWKLLRCMLQQLQQMNIRTFQSRSWFSNEQIGRRRNWEAWELDHAPCLSVSDAPMNLDSPHPRFGITQQTLALAPCHAKNGPNKKWTRHPNQLKQPTQQRWELRNRNHPTIPTIPLRPPEVVNSPFRNLAWCWWQSLDSISGWVRENYRGWWMCWWMVIYFLYFFKIRIQARHGWKLEKLSTKVCMVSQRKRLDVLDWYLEQESG